MTRRRMRKVTHRRRRGPFKPWTLRVSYDGNIDRVLDRALSRLATGKTLAFDSGYDLVNVRRDLFFDFLTRDEAIAARAKLRGLCLRSSIRKKVEP